MKVSKLLALNIRRYEVMLMHSLIRHISLSHRKPHLFVICNSECFLIKSAWQTMLMGICSTYKSLLCERYIEKRLRDEMLTLQIPIRRFYHKHFVWITDKKSSPVNRGNKKWSQYHKISFLLSRVFLSIFLFQDPGLA